MDNSIKNRILGIDLSDMGTVLAYYSEEQAYSYPTVVCKQKDSGNWLIGEEAYEALLSGKGIITDKLLSLIEKDVSATIYNVKYSAVNLLSKFLDVAINDSVKKSSGQKPDSVVVTIPEIKIKVVEGIKHALSKIGFDPMNIHVISRSEAFIYYTMSQSSELHNNNVGLFSLEDNYLVYYEMKVERKAKSTFVFSDKELMDESFNLEIINTEAGAKLADKILLSCAQRLLKNKVFSAIILTGKGFSTQEWASGFMHYICMRRKVFVDNEVFARGAGFRGADFCNEKSVFNFSCICDGRLDYSIFVDINKKDRVVPYPVMSVGESWYEGNHEIKLIPYGVKDLELSIIPMEAKQRKIVRIPLDFLPSRPDKTSVLSLTTTFTDVNNFEFTLSDLGFGEIFASSGKSVSQEVHLWD